jgi:hypothetical protein
MASINLIRGVMLYSLWGIENLGLVLSTLRLVSGTTSYSWWRNIIWSQVSSVRSRKIAVCSHLTSRFGTMLMPFVGGHYQLPKHAERRQLRSEEEVRSYLTSILRSMLTPCRGSSTRVVGRARTNIADLLSSPTADIPARVLDPGRYIKFLLDPHKTMHRPLLNRLQKLHVAAPVIQRLKPHKRSWMMLKISNTRNSWRRGSESPWPRTSGGPRRLYSSSKRQLTIGSAWVRLASAFVDNTTMLTTSFYLGDIELNQYDVGDAKFPA